MRLICLHITFLISITAFGQSYNLLNNNKTCKDELEKKHQDIKAVQADFTESTHSSLLATPQKGSGKMLYKKSDKIRWEKIKPESQVILMNGKSIRIQEKGKEISDATTKTAMKRIQGLMVKMMTGSFLNETEFNIKYYGNSSSYKLVLTPINERLKRYIQTIVLIFKKSDLSLTELSLEKNANDKIVYSFSNMKYNGSIDDTNFTKF